jgi:hypothetical protein
MVTAVLEDISISGNLHAFRALRAKPFNMDFCPGVQTGVFVSTGSNTGPES